MRRHVFASAVAIAILGCHDLAPVTGPAPVEMTPPPVAIEGRILDASTNLPLESALIRITDALKNSQQPVAQTATARDGSYSLLGLAPGRYQLSVRRLGYRPASIELVVPYVSRPTLTLRAVPVSICTMGSWP